MVLIHRVEHTESIPMSHAHMNSLTTVARLSAYVAVSCLLLLISFYMVVCQLKVTTMCTAFSQLKYSSAHAIKKKNHCSERRLCTTRARRVNKRTETNQKPNHISNGVALLCCVALFFFNFVDL